VDDGARVARVVGRRITIAGADDVDEMMRNAALRFGRDLVGADVDAAIDGRRIARDDLAAKRFREPQRELTLAGRRRTDDRDKSARQRMPSL
jgi:hypothetical protein